MVTVDQVYERLEQLAAQRSTELGEIKVALNVLTAHVMGNGGPGINERLDNLEKFEQAEHGVIRFLVIGVPVFVGGIGAVIAILKLAGG